MITIVIGDIHGCLGKLQNLLKHCEPLTRDAAVRFVCIGDYVDRGPDSRGVVQFLIDAEASGTHEWICLMGNHEELMLEPRDEQTWLYNGGLQTLASYGAGRAADIADTHRMWLSRRQLSFDDGLRFFVHAGVDPRVPLDKQIPVTMLWTRAPLHESLDLGRLIVHGHTPVSSGVPELTANRLNIDTGAVYGGPLTAAVFDDKSIRPRAFITDRGRVTRLDE